jgi:predicted ATPase
VASKKLDKLTVVGFKSIKELKDFELGNLNVLIGANGAGKSNFIALFRMINELVAGKLQRYVQKAGGASTLLYHGKKTTPSIDIVLWFGPNGYHCKLSGADNDNLFIEEESAYFFDRSRYSRPYETSISHNGKESGLTSTTGGIGQYVNESMKSWRVYHFHDTSDSAELKNSGNIADNDLLRPNASNLAAYLYLLSEKYPRDYRNIVNTVKLVAPFFESFNLRPNPLNTETIQLEWKHVNSDDYFNAHSLSDGTLRFICLATLLLQPEEKLPSTILLDEPELGLHPYAISILAGMLESVSIKTQIIVSTQSVTLVNQMKPEHIVVVDRDSEQSTFRWLNKEEMSHWIDDFGLGDMWEKNLIGGRP